MPYATVADCTARRGAAAVRLLADNPHASGEPSYTALEACLEDAASEIDSYLAVRHALPLPAPVPRLLVRLNVDIGIHLRSASADVRTNERKERYETAIATLRDLAAGRSSLGAADPDPPAPAAGPAVQFDAAPRVMTRDSLRGVL